MTNLNVVGGRAETAHAANRKSILTTGPAKPVNSDTS